MRARKVVFLFVFLLITGCAHLGGKLTTIRSPGVDRIPTTICVYPLLSSPVHRRYIQSHEVIVSPQRERLYIAAPTEVRLSVTPQSQMFTGLLSSELAYYGFDIKELPVEVPDDSESGETATNVFFISLDLLKRLKEEYGVEAVLIGTVMMDYAPRYSKTLVTAAYLKLVDIETLDVLCQVHLLSEDYGEYLDEAAGALASELALEAGLARIER